MTDSSGSIQARYDYDLYGRQTKLSGSLDANFGYTGHYVHAATGLALSLFRAYDATIGRWISEDPAGMADGPNLYAYAANSPGSFIDPLGLSVLGACLTGAAIGGGSTILIAAFVTGTGGAGALLLGGGLLLYGIYRLKNNPICCAREEWSYAACSLAAGAGAGRAMSWALGRSMGAAAGVSAGARKPGGGEGTAGQGASADGAGRGGAPKSVGARRNPYGPLPDDAKTHATPELAYEHLKEHHGIDPNLASERLHAIKDGAGLAPNDNVLISKTGGIYAPVSREYLGSLTEGGAKTLSHRR
jgi:RHS repeat-associated protein